jgi:hypothetical protein
VIDTTRIRSGFDVEVLLGGGWFRVALQALSDAGRLFPDGAAVAITGVAVVFDPPGRDLRIDFTVDGTPVTALATLALDASGTVLEVTTDLPGVEFSLPLDLLAGLASPPSLAKVAGDGDFDPAIALLANLDLRTSSQSEEPLPAGEHEPRGDPSLALSFLPLGQDMAIGIGKATFPRFANDAWHTQLRAEDGTHPFPDAENEQGNWESVSIAAQSGRIRATLKAHVPIDSPLIDLIPDASITITIDMTPGLADGVVVFTTQVDSDVDTGILGDLVAGIAGGLIGLLIGFLAGGPFIGVSGFVVGIIVLEVAEHVAEGIVERRVRANIEGEPAPEPLLVCRNDVVMEATPEHDEGGLVLGPTRAIPRSIPIHTDRPDALHQRTILVTTQYDEVAMNASGLAIAGAAAAEERFQPLEARLIGRTRAPSPDGEPGQLGTLIYRAANGTTVELPLAEVLLRMAEAELAGSPRVRNAPSGSRFRIPEGRLPSVCLTPTNIRREETVITEALFSSGVDLQIREAVALQDAAALVVHGLQLIHPKDANPYFRAPADETLENNFESLPPF